MLRVYILYLYTLLLTIPNVKSSIFLPDQKNMAPTLTTESALSYEDAEQQPGNEEVQNAMSILESVGLIISNDICFNKTGHNDHIMWDKFYSLVVIPYCVNRRIVKEHETERVEAFNSKSITVMMQNSIMSVLCVVIAALASGLTIGLLSLEVLDLRIAEMTSTCDNERQTARSLIPLVTDHHRLLVTLLLCNSIANEALPLFLDKLVPGYIAIFLSVTLVLFFGEIIPSAIFSGPKKLTISGRLAPLVRCAMLIMSPLVSPIAKFLDHLFHEEDDDTTKYDRKELSALVRIQYEERLYAKEQRKRKIRRNMKKLESSRRHNTNISASSTTSTMKFSTNTVPSPPPLSREPSFDLDEVTMVQGALSMQSKCVIDVMTPLKHVFAISSNTILNEETIIDIYQRGYSRLPIYSVCTNNKSSVSNSNNTNHGICGVFHTRQLMILNPEEERVVSTMPWMTPHCVSSKANMIHCINLLQSGCTCRKGGPMAIVCLRPSVGTHALEQKEPIPFEAGVIGIVTLEDCLEELLQEEIYDEFDKREMIANRRATWVMNRWKQFVKKKQTERDILMRTDVNTNGNNDEHVYKSSLGDSIEDGLCETSRLIAVTTDSTNETNNYSSMKK